MKKQIFAAALLAGMSSIALADQAPSARYMPPGESDAAFARARWQPLTPTLTAQYWFGREVVRVPADRDELSAIRLVNGSGATYVYAVSLQYGDGHVEKLPMNKWLYEGEATMSFKLAREHELKQLTIQTFSWNRSTFQVMGRLSPHVGAPPPYGEPPPPPPAPAVVSLAKNLTFANTNGYLHVPVGGAKGLFSKIQIESKNATTYIGHLHVTFESGAHQTIEVNKTLSGGQILALDLQGSRSAITAIVVMQNHDGRMRSAGRFDLSLIR